MYIPPKPKDYGIHVVQHIVFGYTQSLGIHSIIELNVSSFQHFGEWLEMHYGWRTNYGWAAAIINHAKESKNPLNAFFKLTKEFRKLIPKIIYQVKLETHHQATGERVIIGLSKRMKKPGEIQIMQYTRNLFFLRFKYLTRQENGSLLTSLEEAKRWAEDEFQIPRDDWIVQNN